MYRIAVHGGYNPEYYHFSNPLDLVDWLVENGDSILEVTVSELA